MTFLVLEVLEGCGRFWRFWRFWRVFGVWEVFRHRLVFERNEVHIFVTKMIRVRFSRFSDQHVFGLGLWSQKFRNEVYILGSFGGFWTQNVFGEKRSLHFCDQVY